MNPLQVIYFFISIFLFYVLFARMKSYEARLTRLETRQPVKPEAKAPERVQAKQIWEKEIEGFNPKKPETLRPKQVVGREVNENVFEFDSKI